MVYINSLYATESSVVKKVTAPFMAHKKHPADTDPTGRTIKKALCIKHRAFDLKLYGLSYK
jgi:hypothetical protein